MITKRTKQQPNSLRHPAASPSLHSPAVFLRAPCCFWTSLLLLETEDRRLRTPPSQRHVLRPTMFSLFVRSLGDTHQQINLKRDTTIVNETIGSENLVGLNSRQSELSCGLWRATESTETHVIEHNHPRGATTRGKPRKRHNQ